MTASTGNAPKKEKEKRQTPEERLQALRYNHMMYGPTEGELKHAPKKVDYGASYLKHPKFLNLMTAFRKGTAFSFEVTAGGKVCTVATDGSHISFNDRIVFYSRPLNRFEDNLLLDKTSIGQHETPEALIHLAFAVFRNFPEMGPPLLQYLHKKFYYGPDPLDTGSDGRGTNLLIGSFKHSKAQDRVRK